MLAGVVEVDDLQGTGKMFVSQIPDPRSAVADHDSSTGAVPAPLTGFGEDAAAKLLSGLDGSGVSRGRLVAEWSTLPIELGLGEHATEFGFAGMGGFARLLAGSCEGLGGDHRHTGAIDLDVEDRDRLSTCLGQLQL